MSAKTDLDDYWTQQYSPPETLSEPHLTVETIEDVEPLDAQFGVAEPKTVPDALYEPLFGQPESTEVELEQAGGDPAKVPPLHTYAILDAAKVPGLPELLAASGLEHRCLFKGEAFEDLAEVAPWIVRLEDGNRFTRNLFTRSDARWHLWDVEPGIYVRSRGTLDDMWSHFRKFTRVQDENGKWFYFRFWESGCLIDYVRFSTNSGQYDLRPIFGFDPINPSRPLVQAYVSGDGSMACSVSNMNGHNAQVRAHIDMPVLRFLALKRHAHRFAEGYFAGEGKLPSTQRLRQAKNIAAHIAQKYHSYGFKSRYHLGSFIYWALILNADFEDRTALIQDQLHRKNENPNDRFVLIASEMKSLFGPKIRNYRGYGT